jgi:hypothetical protein
MTFWIAFLVLAFSAMAQDAPSQPITITPTQVVGSPPVQTPTRLNVRPGIWEYSGTLSQPPVTIPKFQMTPEIEAALAKMTPEQRQKAMKDINEAMKQPAKQIQSPESKRQVQMCVSNEELDKGNVLLGAFNSGQKIVNGTKECVSSIRISSSTVLDLHTECSDSYRGTKSERNYHVEAIDFTHMRGMSEDISGPSSSKENFAATWVGENASCTPLTQPQAPAAPQIQPLVTAGFNRLGNNYVTSVTNHSALPVTAYSVLVIMYGSGQMLRHLYYPGVPGYSPVKPGATIQEPRKGILTAVRFLAAIFSDGSTFGDAKEVDILRQRVNTPPTSPAK